MGVYFYRFANFPREYREIALNVHGRLHQEAINQFLARESEAYTRKLPQTAQFYAQQQASFRTYRAKRSLQISRARRYLLRSGGGEWKRMYTLQ